ncbi:Carboxylic ester hydrolase [Mycena sanguinolenta]|uniref:Carboxylic ester hydrolase n=1 Tax=Mycena sanguinolenta TaxID=230812 RepID=A0A8H7D8R5_9AGAR|nr:Carboxylic ester hydrolase [Mycena sanguinolenta]
MDVGFNLRFFSKLISSSFPLLFASNYADPENQAKCLALKSSLNLDNTTILDVAYVLGGTTVHTPGPPTSAIRAETWLPDEWHGRFLGLGNGGLGGCIFYNHLDYGSSMHFATVGSNNGHDGYTGLPFLQNPEVINDFAFRSIHTEAVIGKQIVEAYYEKPHSKAYYLGCSTGGRQGTQTALRYPDDFDGILAGAPATDFNRLLHWTGMTARAIGAPNAAEAPAPEFIPPALWRVVAEEVLAQCDELDGVRDGIITEPDACDFRPEALACNGRSTEQCLTSPQVEALHKIYAPLYDNAELVYPRSDPGSEGVHLGETMFTRDFPRIIQDWLKYAVLNVSEYDFTTYHGRADPEIPSGNSKRMYTLLADTLGTPSLDAFYRLFLVPGMAHCVGGPPGADAAYMFGQVGGMNARNASSHNALLALVEWVEGGMEPESIIGTSEDGKERVHCRFPLLFASNYADPENQAKCLALKSSLNLDNTTILDVAYVLGGTTVNTTGPCVDEARVSVPLCRVQFSTQTSPTSAIRAEAWLPDEWHGRFLGLGNGGLGGCIFYNDLEYGSSMHFATVGSNNGHDGYTGLPFLGNPEIVNDFAFRSIHTEAVIGKQIVEAYYEKPHSKAYYLGCSTGGRQGTQTALRYPEDFDGILAGAPATDFNHLLHWMGMTARAIGAPNPPTHAPEFIPPNLWRVVAEEVLVQCDALDGVRDRIITEPDACNFRPEALACDGGSTEGCLMPPQVEALHKIYAPLSDNGELLYPRSDPGSEGVHLGGMTFIGDFPSITEDWLKYAVLNVTDYNSTTYGPAEGRLMDAVNPGGIATFEGNMSAFRDRGGKFLTYHGRADPIIASGNSKRMYTLLTDTLGTPSLDAFYRLFLVPGMAHCVGGPPGADAAYKFGQLGGMNARNESSHNALLALVDWVEGGMEPENIIGTTEDGKERVHCRYPMRSVWDGEGFGCDK